MGNCFSSNIYNIKIIDETPLGEQLEYLRPEGTITYTIDRMYDVPEIEINLNGWYKSSVPLWPKYPRMRSNFLRIKRTPLPLPSVSSVLYDSGHDTVF